MRNEEQLIRDLIADWQNAVAAGDLSKLLPLMAEDVVFLLAGQPPMRGRNAFAAAFQNALEQVRIMSTASIQEIQIAGDFAYCCNHLHVTVTPLHGGSAMSRSGYTLTILRKEAEGQWVIFRDANMLAAEPANPA